MPFDFDKIVRAKYDILPISTAKITSSPAHIQAHEPSVLWVGCSDSLVSETNCLQVPRDEVFVHRNLGNILSNGDLSSESAVEWAVDLLKVKHIVICGHYDCALIKAEDDVTALHGWYKDVTKLRRHTLRATQDQSQQPTDEYSRCHRIEEVYVLAEVDWLKRQPNVKRAMKEWGLQVHAFVFDKERGTCVRLVERKS
ncbi:carbonic anhydrase [Halenospora varia]|nr:carbonic anhydrase [Halenospora varia]